MPRDSGADTGTKRSSNVRAPAECERLGDLGDVLVLERLVGAQVDRARRMVRRRRRHDAAPDEPVMPTISTLPSRRPAFASGNHRGEVCREVVFIGAEL